jgi:hypothetical protein
VRASFLKRHFHRGHGSAVKAFDDHCRISATRNSSVNGPLRKNEFYCEAALICAKAEQVK